LFNIKRLLHDIFHIGPGISLRLPYQSRQRSWRADMDRGLIPGTIWKISCHNLFITYFTLTFILQKRSLNWQIAKNKSLRVAFCSTCKYFFFEFCTMTLESVCKIYPRRWLYSNILKHVNLIEIRFYHLSFYLLWHIFLETTVQIPEIKFGGKYGYLRANNQHWLLAIIGHAKTNLLQQNMW
jgi:hypothetical protein